MKEKHLLSYAYYLVISIIIISKEFVGFRILFGLDGHNRITTLCLFIFLWVFCGSSYLKVKGSEGLNVWGERWHTSLLFITVLSVFYFVYHEFKADDDFVSIKYASYCIFLLMLIVNADIYRASVVYSHIIILMSLMTIAQSVMMRVEMHPITAYEIVPQMVDILNRGETFYTNPFYLGLLRYESLVEYGNLSLYRSCGYTTEPKYHSLLLMSGLVAILFTEQGKIKRHLKLLIVSIALFITHSYSTFVTLILTLTIIIFAKFRISRSRIMTVVLMFAPLLVVRWVVVNLSDIISIIGGGFAAERLYALNSSFAAIDNMRSLIYYEITPMGHGIITENLNLPAIFLMLIRYGLIGVALYGFMLFILYRTGIDVMRHTASLSAKTVIALSISIIETSFVIFLPEFITPSFCYIVAVAVATIIAIREDAGFGSYVSLRL